MGNSARHTIITASLPRSGNVFLLSLLSACLDDRPVGEHRLWVCVNFDRPDCCRQRPCSRKPWRPLAVMRTHDPDLDFPADVPRAFYVVQYREPLGQILSFADRVVAKDGGFPNTGEDYLAWWAAKKADRTIAFLEKWVRQPSDTRFMLPYETLKRDASGTLHALFSRLGLAIDPQRITGSAAAQANLLGDYDKDRTGRSRVPYRPRDMSQSAVLPWRTAKAYEACVRARSPFAEWPEPSSALQHDPGFDDLVGAARLLRTGGGQAAADGANPWMLRDFAKKRKAA